MLAYYRDKFWDCYAKVRMLTVFLFWPLLIILQFERIHRVIFLEEQEKITTLTYIREVLIVILLVIFATIDFNFNRFVYWEVKRRQNEQIEEEKNQIDYLIK